MTMQPQKWRNQSQSIRTISHHRIQEEQSLKTITKWDSYCPEKAQHLTQFQL